MKPAPKPNNDKRALVVGLGLTGLSCVRHLAARGYKIAGVDTRAAPPKLDDIRRVCPQAELHAGGLPDRWFDDPGLLVVSPGVSLKEPPIARAIARGIQPVGDIELFARTATAPVLAVTGSNGKSTVTALVGEMCQAGGLTTRVGGNIGTPALDLLAEPEPDVYVLELSSFQLETTSSLNARAATVLNISPDHMDRYATLDDYAEAKARIFRGNGTLVLNADDTRVRALAISGRRVVHFGLDAPLGAADYGLRRHADEDWIVRGTTLLAPAHEVPLSGRHNLANALAALALSETVGVAPTAQVAALRAFHGLPHRTEVVADLGGVRWINDSKGTNVGATVAALNGMTAPTVLIAGGDGKGQDFAALRAAVSAHARAVVLIGRDAPRISTALAGTVPLISATTLPEAVSRAKTLAHAGDVVLLSPACASFDMFRNYEHRGDVFRAAVRELLT